MCALFMEVSVHLHSLFFHRVIGIFIVGLCECFMLSVLCYVFYIISALNLMYGVQIFLFHSVAHL